MASRVSAIVIDGLWRRNTIIAGALALCHAMAVGNRLDNGITLSVAVIFVVTTGSLVSSAIKNYLPLRLRLIVFMVILSTVVIAIDQFLKGFFPDISRQLGPYVALIITNCLVLARLETFAIKNPVRHSLIDALSHGLGYSLVLLLISAVREVLAFGTLLNVKVMGEGWTGWVVMAMAPGGFFVLAMVVLLARTLQKEQGETGEDASLHHH